MFLTVSAPLGQTQEGNSIQTAVSRIELWYIIHKYTFSYFIY